jgi:hypothetical protein
VSWNQISLNSFARHRILFGHETGLSHISDKSEWVKRRGPTR